MKRAYILTIALISVISTLQGQKLKDSDVIKMNSKFILKLETLDSIHYSFKVIKTEPFYQTVNLSESKSLFDENVEDGYIQGIFTYGKFGNSTNCFLMLKNGLEQSLDYELKIKVKSKRKPVKTSVVSLYSNVVSTELWSYDIEYLIFSNFKRVEQFQFKEDYTFKPTIDSTCIKNPKNNQQFADSLFMDYIDTLNYYFFSPNGLNIEKVIDFENSIKSIEIKREYAISLGESIYPNKNKYKLERPVEYRRAECPYFNVNIQYFYTKKDNSVKVILFEWNAFRKSDALFAEDDMDIKQKDEIFREKFSKIETVLTNLLGEPTLKDIKSEKGETNCRDDIEWLKDNTLKADSFMFVNDGTNYRQIRLAIYKE